MCLYCHCEYEIKQTINRISDEFSIRTKKQRILYYIFTYRPLLTDTHPKLFCEVYSSKKQHNFYKCSCAMSFFFRWTVNRYAMSTMYNYPFQCECWLERDPKGKRQRDTQHLWKMRSVCGSVLFPSMLIAICTKLSSNNLQMHTKVESFIQQQQQQCISHLLEYRTPKFIWFAINAKSE